MKAAFSEASTMSASTTKWSPAPTARPFTQQITGFQTPFWRGDQNTSWSRGRLFATSPPAPTDWTSRPVEKCFSPAAPTIATRTSGSSRTSAQRARQRRSMGLVSELPRSGRSRVMRAMPPAFS